MECLESDFRAVLGPIEVFSWVVHGLYRALIEMYYRSLNNCQYYS